jgi:DNA-binding SARP family transcriptional activator
MQFRLLGSLEVSVAGHPVDLEAARLQVIVAVLLLEANNVVSVSRLIDAIWDDDPPATARSQVQICISTLRRLLADGAEADVIVTRSPGYMLVVPDEARDISQFELLVARGRAAAAEQRPVDAVADLRAGLGLWRGPAAAGIESRIVRMAVTRLDENRLAVLGDCLKLELELGHHREVIGELRGLVAEYPLRERLRMLLMLALYRAGRQADALESFREVRELLLDELGLDPGEELRDMERAILANDRSLDVQPVPVRAGGLQPVPRQLPATLADFTGRDDILERICALLAPADGTVPQYLPVVTLTGKGGIGKTTLALHAAHQISEAFPDGQLYAQLHGTSSEPRPPASLLEGFLRSFGVPPATVPDSVDERMAMYRSWLSGRRVLVVLDDAGSLSQVLPVLPGSATCAVIITTRNRLGGPDGAQQFEVEAFDDPSGVRLLASVIGADRVRSDEAAAGQLVRLCDRLPIALRIVAAKLAARPHWPISQMVRRLEDGKRRLDELNLDGVSVRATISFSYESLGKEERRLLALLSLLGPGDFSPWVGSPLLGVDVGTAADLLEELVASRLVEAWVSTGGSVRYQLHDLVRLFAVERLVQLEAASARTEALGRLLGCWLFLAGEAHRRECGGDFSLLHGHADLWRLPEATVDELLADPLGWLHHERPALVAAIHQAARASFDELCWDLATTAVTLFEAGNYVDDWRTTHEAALEVVRRTGNRRGEAAVTCSLATLSLTKQPDEAARLLETALAAFDELDDVHGKALALGQLAFVDRLSGREEEAVARYRQALSWFRASGDLIGEIDMLRGIAKIYLDRDQGDAAETLLAEASQLCRRVRSRRVKAQTMFQLGEFYLKRDGLQLAEESFDEVLRVTREANDTIGQAYGLLGAGTVYSARGDYAVANEKLQSALESARGTGHFLVQGQILLALAEVAALRNDDAGAMGRLEAAREVLHDLGPEATVRARLLGMHAQLDTKIS